MKDRLNEIKLELRTLTAEIEEADADKMTALEERFNTLKAEKEGIEKDIEEREAKEQALEDLKEGRAKAEEIEKRGEPKMETRNTNEYIHAFANYVKTGRDAECRALMSDLADDGTVPAPTFVEDRISSAWERLSLLGRVKRTNFKGNLKVGVELSASGAASHQEGGDPVAEEELIIATVEMRPFTLKKWISFTDEILDMNDRAFLEYIYDEITYKIFDKAEYELQDEVIQATANGSSSPQAPEVTISEIGLGDFVNAAGSLQGSGTPVVITNRKVYAAYKALAMAANYGVDPFDGMDVIFTNYAYDTTAGEVAALVGYPEALQINFVNGEEAQMKYDDTTLATSDLVRVIGRLPVSVGYVQNKGFAKIKVNE